LKASFATKRLAFGSGIKTWRHVEQLQELGITHVINLRRNVHNKKVRQFECLWLPFKDDKQPRPRWFYRKALKFYKGAMRKRNAKVVVICRMGICRSASLTYFLLRASGKSEGEARKLVIDARSWAVVGRAYRESGEEYLRTRHVVDVAFSRFSPPSPCSPAPGSVVR
jgi:protein-tyrosine phosphatase